MSSSVSVIIVTWIQIAFQNYWNRLSGKKSKGSLIMKRSKERDTSRIYPLSKKAKEVSPMPQAAVTAGMVFMV